MKALKLTVASVGVTLALAMSASVMAQGTNGPAGTYVSCTNACITTVDGSGETQIMDCCGGQVHWVIVR